MSHWQEASQSVRDNLESVAAWRAIRTLRASRSDSASCLFLSAKRGAFREEIEPRRTYWAVLSQNMDRAARGLGTSTADRLFYVRRARAMRRNGFKDNWAGCGPQN